MKMITCTERQHAVAILDIFNDAILTSTALYDYKPRHIDSMTSWFATKLTNNFPVIGLEDEQGALLGFASYGTFRAWPAYKYSVEHSIYIHKDHRGKGLGKILLNALVDAARERGDSVIPGPLNRRHLNLTAGWIWPFIR